MATNKVRELPAETEKVDNEKQIEKLNEFFKNLMGECSQNKQPENFSKYRYYELMDIMDTYDGDDGLEESDIEWFEACEREIDRRWETYRAWKVKNVPEEERHNFPKEKPLKEYRIFCSDSFDILFRYPEILETGNNDESEC